MQGNLMYRWLCGVLSIDLQICMCALACVVCLIAFVRYLLLSHARHIQFALAFSLETGFVCPADERNCPGTQPPGYEWAGMVAMASLTISKQQVSL